MGASAALLALGLLALTGIANAARPARAWWAIAASWPAAWVTVELAPHLVALSALVGTALVAAGALDSPSGWIGLAALLVSEAVAIPWILRSRRTVLDLESVVGELDAVESVGRYPRTHILLPFLAWRRRGVRRIGGVEYSRPDGRPLRLDIYLPRAGAEGLRPAIVNVHGGGWLIGSRREQGVPLLGHLAANGWVGFNIDYRLSPRATFPEHLDDVHRAVAWVREHADEYAVDPSFVAITGGSAGGHLSALAALTAASASEKVQACVPFYGVYDLLDEDRRHLPILHAVLERVVFKARRADDAERFRAASPITRVHAGAPPFFVIHGERDSLVPVEEARTFVERLRAVSPERVLYAEMRGGQHAFDVIPSWRTIPVIEAIERFLAAERARGGAPRETPYAVLDERRR